MSAYGFRAHELIEQLSKDSPFCKDCMDAAKFDLGSLDAANDLSALSKGEFFDIPAPICLFQCTNEENEPYFLLAKKSSDYQICNPATQETSPSSVIWRLSFKYNGRWIYSSLYVIVDRHGCVAIFDSDTGKFVDDVSKLDSNDKWTLDIVLGVAKAIEVFSCSNVITIEQSAPKFLNEKRLKKGKVPFFSYRTLHITRERTEYQHDKDTKGTHASPRLHLRRGHIRCYASGKKIWVQSCLVGDKSKGVSQHDYRVNYKPQNQVASLTGHTP